MAIALCLVCRTGVSHELRKFRLQQALDQFPGPEGNVAPDNFGAIVARQANWRDLAWRPDLTYSSTAPVTSIAPSETNTAFSARLGNSARTSAPTVMVWWDWPTEFRYAAPYFHVGTRTIGAAERVAGSAPGDGLAQAMIMRPSKPPVIDMATEPDRPRYFGVMRSKV